MGRLGRPPKYETARQMENLIEKYFEKCDEEGKPYTVTGLALAVGMTRKMLIDYEEKGEFRNTIRTAKAIVEEYVESHTYMGKINASAGIFSLKNFGWSDKTEIDANVDAEIKVTLDGQLEEWAR